MNDLKNKLEGYFYEFLNFIFLNLSNLYIY
jgi:hypothetical protein